MKLTLIAAVSALSTLASGMVILDPSSMVISDPSSLARTFRPAIAIVIQEAFPDSAYPPTRLAKVSRKNGGQNVKTLLGFNIPAFPSGKSCTLSFSDATSASGSGRMFLFTTGGYPAFGNTWNMKPFTDIHKGTFQLKDNGAGPATVVENFGLTFDCPTTAASFGFEVQPVWDNDLITWDITAGGFIITANY